jgi:putative methionine-R-sulfoxide reductase with GAF domain
MELVLSLRIVERRSEQESKMKASWGVGEACREPRDMNSRNENDGLSRSTWRNWFLLAGVLLFTTFGLGSAVLPLTGERIVRPWPWLKTDWFLIAGLSVVTILFIARLTEEQRRVLAVHRQMEELREESNRRMRKQLDRLYALTKLGRAMADEIELSAVFNRITEICLDIFSCHRASLMLYEKETNELVIRAVSGLKDREILDVRQPLGEGIAGWAAQRCEALLLGGPDSTKTYPDLELRNLSISSAMVVPINLRGELVGVINVSSKSPDIHYDVDDLHALQAFAETTGAYIRHAEQAHWMRQTIKKLRLSRERGSKTPAKADALQPMKAECDGPTDGGENRTVTTGCTSPTGRRPYQNRRSVRALPTTQHRSPVRPLQINHRTDRRSCNLSAPHPYNR